MNIDKTSIKKILFITLSNIGDVILTLPVLGVLKREFPKADITVMPSKSTKEIFEADEAVSKIIVYNKRIPLLEKLQFAFRLRKRGFDLVVDLRHSLFPAIIGSRYHNPFFKSKYKNLHRVDKHLKELESIGIDINNAPFEIPLNRDDKLDANSILNDMGLLPDDKMVAIAPGAKSHIKRWHETGFSRLCDKLNRELGIKALLVGDESDREINQKIKAVGLKETYDLTSKTTIRQLTYIFSLCSLVVTNDSAPLHIASALNIPTVAIFGPTDEKKYGPLAKNSVVVRRPLKCSPCEIARCKYNLECMKEIKSDEVFDACKSILSRNVK